MMENKIDIIAYEKQERIFKYIDPTQFPCVYCDVARWVAYEDGFSCESCGCTTTGERIYFNGVLKLTYLCYLMKFQIIPNGNVMAWMTETVTGKLEKYYKKSDYPDLTEIEIQELAKIDAMLDFYNCLTKSNQGDSRGH